MPIIGDESHVSILAIVGKVAERSMWLVMTGMVLMSFRRQHPELAGFEQKKSISSWKYCQFLIQLPKSLLPNVNELGIITQSPKEEEFWIKGTVSRELTPMLLYIDQKLSL